MKTFDQLCNEADQEDKREIVKREAAIKVLKKEIEQIKRGIK